MCKTQNLFLSSFFFKYLTRNMEMLTEIVAIMISKKYIIVKEDMTRSVNLQNNVSMKLDIHTL